jgi:hemolysin activation/secretion protein
VLNFDAMKKDLVKLNGQADRRVTPALKAGKQPGTVDVDLAVDDSLPLHGSLELNDRRSQDTSELRLLASLSYDNLWQLGHSLTVSYQTAPQNQSDARVLFASYLARFAGSPYSVLVNGIKSDSNVSTVGGTDVIGNGTTVGLEGIAQLPGSDVFYDTLMFGVDYKHVRNVVGVGQDSFETPVTYYPFTLGYTGVWRKPAFTTQLDLSAHFAVPEFGSRVEELQLNRSNAHGQQAYLRGGLSHTQTLWRGMEGYVHVAGQWSDEPLLTTEQFSIGGADTVRGYLEAEALGDNGYYANVELRSPSFADDLGFGGTKPFQDLRMVAFYDSGQVDLRMATPDQTPRFLLGSFGAGVNMKLLSHVNGSLYWAEPYLSGPATAHWQSRILFRVSSYF